jgi:hypothetical protein
VDLTGIQEFINELRKWKIPEYTKWAWARYDPVAYLWLCRAERRGARVPWS